MTVHALTRPGRASVRLALLTLLLAAPRVQAAARPATDLAALVPGLVAATAAERLAFVESAVVELEAAYRPLLAAPGAAPRWAAATLAYMRRLERAASAAAAGAPVAVLVEPAGAVRVVVRGAPLRQFMITSPRAGGTRALEQAIVRRYCRAVSCGGAPAGRSAGAAALAGRGQVTTAVPAAVRAPVAPAGDGLACATVAQPHGRLLTSACHALVAELRELAEALAATGRHGRTVDFAALRPPRRHGALHQVTLNRRGEYLSLALPALARAPEVWLAAQPWLRARLAGKVSPLALAPPARLVYAAR